MYDERLYKRVLYQGSLGFGEAYMDKWWDCQQLDQMIARIMCMHLKQMSNHRRWLAIKFLLSKLNIIKTFLLIKKIKSVLSSLVRNIME